MDDLNDRERAFVEYYFICKFNGTKAAKKAGYSARSARQTAAKVLAKPEVRRVIDERLAELKITANEVLARLSDFATGSMDDLLDESGDLDIVMAKETGSVRFIKRLTITKRFAKDGSVSSETTKVEMHDTLAALVHMGRHYKLFTDRHELVDWRAEAIDLIRGGKISFDALADEVEEDLATELFTAAGVPIVRGKPEGEE